MTARLLLLLQIYRTPLLASIDSGAWIAAMFAGVALRLETARVAPALTITDADGAIPLYGCLVLGAAAALVHVLLASVLRLHQGRHAIGSFEELFTLASVVVVAGTVIGIGNVLVDPFLVPRTSIFTSSVLALVLMAWLRALWRLQWVQRRPNWYGAASTPVIIIGAGEGGRELIRAMHRDPERTWRPVAFIDDDKRKRHFRYRGVEVRGTTEGLGPVAEGTGASTVIIAMPSASSDVVSRIYDRATEAELEVKVLPSVHELLGGVSIDDVRDLEPADLLGRHQIRTDVASIAGYLTGRTVLVTGAGGSIGAELCRQIQRYSPAALLMLDRDESVLHSLALSLHGKADLGDPHMLLADIRDHDRVVEIFDRHRPDVVFHAAALKHVNMLEVHPAEAVKTNVLGTLNVLRAAQRVGVSRFVNISTDKAAGPENVLGWSKRLAEGLTAAAGRSADGTYLSVRFGNVLGTRGSVLMTFNAQIERGGPVTVTDPEVTRFFMTIDEAVQLVIQAAAIGRDGEALVLDMGTPVKIIDVARQMIRQSGRDIDIVVTGLRPGEKLHEVLFAGTEDDVRPFHPEVSHVRVPPSSVDGVRTTGTTAQVVAALKAASDAMAGDHAAEACR